MLVRIRHILDIPAIFLCCRRDSIIIRFHGTTDWDRFRELCVQADSLVRIGEKEPARELYESSFQLVKGEPLSKSYDRWAVDYQRLIETKIADARHRYQMLE
ncbi:MAG TPA: hypothetical protein EYP58_04465 [bacterium (Candidatus Stahlbacteria)]|nr:hypothetical protein [Candidatus Stahlbacteria bacterium]